MTIHQQGEFRSAAEMLSHYNAVRRRLNSGQSRNPIGSPLTPVSPPAATPVADTTTEPPPGPSLNEAWAVFYLALVMEAQSAREAFEGPPIGRRRIRVNDIIIWTAGHFGLAAEDLVGPHRTKNFVWPRQIAMWLTLKIRPDMSLPETGRRFGGKDHTTVLHSKRRVEEEIAKGTDRGREAERALALLTDILDTFDRLKGGDPRT